MPDETGHVSGDVATLNAAPTQPLSLVKGDEASKKTKIGPEEKMNLKKQKKLEEYLAIQEGKLEELKKREEILIKQIEVANHQLNILGPKLSGENVDFETVNRLQTQLKLQYAAKAELNNIQIVMDLRGKAIEKMKGGEDSIPFFSFKPGTVSRASLFKAEFDRKTREKVIDKNSKVVFGKGKKIKAELEAKALELKETTIKKLIPSKKDINAIMGKSIKTGKKYEAKHQEIIKFYEEHGYNNPHDLKEERKLIDKLHEENVDFALILHKKLQAEYYSSLVETVRKTMASDQPDEDKIVCIVGEGENQRTIIIDAKDKLNGMREVYNAQKAYETGQSIIQPTSPSQPEPENSYEKGYDAYIEALKDARNLETADAKTFAEQNPDLVDSWMHSHGFDTKKSVAVSLYKDVEIKTAEKELDEKGLLNKQIETLNGRLLSEEARKNREGILFETTEEKQMKAELNNLIAERDYYTEIAKNKKHGTIASTKQDKGPKLTDEQAQWQKSLIEGNMSPEAAAKFVTDKKNKDYLDDFIAKKKNKNEVMQQERKQEREHAASILYRKNLMENGLSLDEAIEWSKNEYRQDEYQQFIATHQKDIDEKVEQNRKGEELKQQFETQDNTPLPFQMVDNFGNVRTFSPEGKLESIEENMPDGSKETIYDREIQAELDQLEAQKAALASAQILANDGAQSTNGDQGRSR